MTDPSDQSHPSDLSNSRTAILDKIYRIYRIGEAATTDGTDNTDGVPRRGRLRPARVRAKINSHFRQDLPDFSGFEKMKDIGGNPASAGRRVNARSIAPPLCVASDRGYAREAATFFANLPRYGRFFCTFSTLWKIPRMRDHSVENSVLVAMPT